ncbi:hypothetical protein ACX0G7_24000 [Flavitalea antarctica]
MKNSARFASAVILTMALCYLGGLVLPWWIIAPVGLFTGYLIQLRPATAFLAGFIACFLLWFCLAFVIDYKNEHILATRIGALFTLKQPLLMILITGLIGGLVTGMASLTGALLRTRLKRPMAA